MFSFSRWIFISLRCSQMSSPGSPLPPASLHLLVPPVRLMSTFIWQVVQQCSVMHYDKVADFISLATEIVPELLNPSQRAHLIMNLRARVRDSSQRMFGRAHKIEMSVVPRWCTCPLCGSTMDNLHQLARLSNFPEK